MKREAKYYGREPIAVYSYSEKDKEYVKEETPDKGRGRIIRNSMFVYGDTVVLAPMSNAPKDGNFCRPDYTFPEERIPAFCRWCQKNKPKTLLIPLTLSKNPREIGDCSITHSVYLKVDFIHGIATIVDSKYYLGRIGDYIEANKNIIQVIEKLLGLNLRRKVDVLRTQKYQDLRHCTRYTALGIIRELESQQKFQETITSVDSLDEFSYTVKSEHEKSLDDAYKAGEEKMPEPCPEIMKHAILEDGAIYQCGSLI